MGTVWKVPREWPGATVVCLASGPSLTEALPAVERWHAADADDPRRAIAVSDAYRLAPWADLLYSCDAAWWRLHLERVKARFIGACVTIDACLEDDRVLTLGQDARGMSDDPSTLGTGSNSGYQAVNLACLLGARRVVLVGYDMRRVHGRSHFFGEHPEPLGVSSPYALFIEAFAAAAGWLRDRGVEVVNCTPGSALTCFPFKPLEDALGR